MKQIVQSITLVMAISLIHLVLDDFNVVTAFLAALSITFYHMYLFDDKEKDKDDE